MCDILYSETSRNSYILLSHSLKNYVDLIIIAIGFDH